jgi:hypothetical protein
MAISKKDNALVSGVTEINTIVGSILCFAFALFYCGRFDLLHRLCDEAKNLAEEAMDKVIKEPEFPDLINEE